jgi:hypothetical protein
MIFKVVQTGLWNRLPIEQEMYFISEDEARKYFEYAVRRFSEHCIVSEEENCTQIHGPETAMKISLISGNTDGIKETMDIWSTFYPLRDDYYLEVTEDALDTKSIAYLYEGKGNHRKVPLVVFNSDAIEPEEVVALCRDKAEDEILKLEENN